MTFIRTERILIVAAHPDDEVLGCGATIAKYTKAGVRVSVLLLGEGPLSRYEKREEGLHQKDVVGVPSFIERASHILGVEKVFAFQFPDNKFDTVPLLELVKTVAKVKEALQPTIIFTHHRADLNIDHRLTHQAVITACRPIEGETVREIYSWENPSSTEWNHPNLFQPNMFMDVHETLAKKIEALRCYETEVRTFPHPRSEEALRALAAWRGSTAGIRTAEAFEVVRIIAP